MVSGATLHGVTVCRPLHTDALLSHERGEQLVVLVASISSTAQQSGCVHVLAAREFPAADIEKSMIAEAQRSSNNRACRRTPSHFGIAAPSGEIAPAIDLLCDAGVQISWADAGAAFVNRPVSAQANPAGHSRHHHNPGERPRALSSLTRQSLASREPLSGPLSRPSPTATATDPSPGDGAKALPSAARMAAQSPAQMRGKSKGAAAPPMFPGAKLRPEADGTGGQQQSATAAVHRGAAATLQQGFITAVGNSSVTATFGRGAFATDVEQSRVPPAWRQTGTTEEGGKRKEAFAAKVPLVPRKRRLHEGGAPPHADKADHAPEAIRIGEAPSLPTLLLLPYTFDVRL